jgi:CBS domain-containing protein
MTTEVITSTPDTPLIEAARVLTERKIGCLPVVEARRLVGIITEGDFVALAAREGRQRA